MRLPVTSRPRRGTTLALSAAGAAGLVLAALVPGATAAGAATADVAVAAAPHLTRSVAFKAPFSASTPAALPTPSECLSEDGAACLMPTDMRSAYDIPDTISGQPAGTGETIMLVDAYGSPTAQADLDHFSTTMGIPSTTIQVFTPDGAPDWSAPTTTQYGWAGETDLDVQWAHAIAPGATIDLVVAPDDGSSLDDAMRWGLQHLQPDTMSMSYGDPEASWAGDKSWQKVYAADSQSFAKAAKTGTTIFASSGDDWSDDGLGVATFQAPADDPDVTAVGGTTLNQDLDPSLPGEFVWNDFDACPYGCAGGILGGTGGAPSLVTAKGGSDVAYDASPYTGVLVYRGFYPSASSDGFYFTGGTSAGSPQWAALTADVDQATGQQLGAIDGDLAGWAAQGGLHDVTVGDNVSPTYSGGFSAGPGWDVPTGYGTPDVGRIIDLVAASPAAKEHGKPSYSGPHTDPAHRGRLK